MLGDTGGLILAEVALMFDGLHARRHSVQSAHVV